MLGLAGRGAGHREGLRLGGAAPACNRRSPERRSARASSSASPPACGGPARRCIAPGWRRSPPGRPRPAPAPPARGAGGDGARQGEGLLRSRTGSVAVCPPANPSSIAPGSAPVRRRAPGEGEGRLGGGSPRGPERRASQSAARGPPRQRGSARAARPAGAPAAGRRPPGQPRLPHSFRRPGPAPRATWRASGAGAAACSPAAAPPPAGSRPARTAPGGRRGWQQGRRLAGVRAALARRWRRRRETPTGLPGEARGSGRQKGCRALQWLGRALRWLAGRRGAASRHPVQPRPVRTRVRICELGRQQAVPLAAHAVAHAPLLQARQVMPQRRRCWLCTERWWAAGRQAGRQAGRHGTRSRPRADHSPCPPTSSNATLMPCHSTLPMLRLPPAPLPPPPPSAAAAAWPSSTAVHTRCSTPARPVVSGSCASRRRGQPAMRLASRRCLVARPATCGCVRRWRAVRRRRWRWAGGRGDRPPRAACQLPLLATPPPGTQPAPGQAQAGAPGHTRAAAPRRPAGPPPPPPPQGPPAPRRTGAAPQLWRARAPPPAARRQRQQRRQ